MTQQDAAAVIEVQVRTPEPADHRYHVRLTVPAQAVAHSGMVLVSLPVWIPGSYLVREFARHLMGLRARQGRRVCAVEQTDKCSWTIQAKPGLPIQLDYQVYAFDASVRAAWLDAQRGFFNSTSLCLRVHGCENLPHVLELCRPAGSRWKAVTALEPVQVQKSGYGRYLAPDYDALADAPVEMGEFWEGRFDALGVPHRFIVASAPPSFDGDRLLADTRRICEAALGLWHPSAAGGKARRQRAPFERYVFMLNTVADGYGGLEHRNSTALICTRRDLPQHNTPRDKPGEGYTTLMGLISHEYFHAWSVKRLRPAEFTHYDYSRENHTELLWFFEGFTSYYDDLLLRRAQLIDDNGYLRLLNKTINQVHQTPGRLVQSVAQASFDAWTKYYRPDENTANATVSYYTKGALVALCLDLTLRSEGRTTLDAVMRGLWLRCKAGPMREQDLLDVLETLGGRSFEGEIKRWVHSTEDLPLRSLLQAHGVAVHDDPAQLAQRLGLRVSEGTSVVIKTVLHGSAAQAAGLAANDEWLAVRPATQRSGGWRMGKLDDLLLYAGAARRLVALISRDQRLLELPFTLPPEATTWRLSVKDIAALRRWLDATPQT